MRRVAALLAGALLAGCSSREHANPFDPENPLTGGRPAGFVALAGASAVDLRWNPPELAGDFEYQLFRRIQGEADFRSLGPRLSGATTRFVDSPLTDGLLHEYRLYFVFSGQPGGLPAEDAGTPGPLRPWCTDLSRRTLIGITPDGRHVVSETAGFSGPTFVAADATRGLVWVSDTYAGKVVIFNPVYDTRTTIPNLTEPVAIALDPLDQSAWVCDQGRDVVHHFAPSGLSATPAQLTDISKPIGVACNPEGGAIWVCERGLHQVRRFSRAGVTLGSTALLSPSRVAVDALTGDAWVTSFEGGRIVRFTSDGVARDTVGLRGPIGVAVDSPNGRIWVADTRAAEVVAVSRGGYVEFRVGALTGVLEIAVDLATGEAWATVPQQSAIVRISPTGAVLQRLQGLAEPYGIALDPGITP